MVDYKLYLKSDEWRKTRSHIRRRARGWCERCKVGKRADVHHLTYARLGCERLDDLLAVCTECHEFLHGLRDVDPAATTYSEQEIHDLRELSVISGIMGPGIPGVWDVLTHPRYIRAWAKRERSLFAVQK